MQERNTPRLPVVTNREELPEVDRQHWDLIQESRGGVRGPFSVLLNSPEAAGRVSHLGAYLRYESVLSGNERELAILTTACELNCRYEWAAHVKHGRDEGVTEEAIEIVANRRPVDPLTSPEDVIVRYGREILADHSISETTFQEAIDYFGPRAITDLTVTIGYYCLIAIVLNAFCVLPEEEVPFS